MKLAKEFLLLDKWEQRDSPAQKRFTVFAADRGWWQLAIPKGVVVKAKRDLRKRSVSPVPSVLRPPPDPRAKQDRNGGQGCQTDTQFQKVRPHWLRLGGR
jgi:hypothetical protein